MDITLCDAKAGAIARLRGGFEDHVAFIGASHHSRRRRFQQEVLRLASCHPLATRPLHYYYPATLAGNFSARQASIESLVGCFGAGLLQAMK